MVVDSPSLETFMLLQNVCMLAYSNFIIPLRAINASEITSYFLSFGFRPHSHILKLNLWLISSSYALRAQWETQFFDWRWMEADRNMLTTACGVENHQCAKEMERNNHSLHYQQLYFRSQFTHTQYLLVLLFLFQYGKSCWIISLVQCCHVSCSSCWIF